MYLIAMRSVTFANKGKQYLSKEGIWCNIRRSPQAISSCGCGYSIVVDGADLVTAVKIFEKNDIPYEGLWQKRSDGSYREMGM